MISAVSFADSLKFLTRPSMVTLSNTEVKDIVTPLVGSQQEREAVYSKIGANTYFDEGRFKMTVTYNIIQNHISLISFTAGEGEGSSTYLMIKREDNGTLVIVDPGPSRTTLRMNIVEVNIRVQEEYNFICLVSFVQGKDQIKISGLAAGVLRSSASTGSTDSTMLLSAGEPRIKIFAETEVFYGANLMLSVFKTEDSVYLRRPALTKVVAGKGCTLAAKIAVNAGKQDKLLQGVISYGMLRYFLWYLITGKWCVAILKRRYTRKFFSVLATSDYKNFVPVFSELGLNVYEKYFIW